MTIFQKMILAPIISLFLYIGFITYSFFEHQNSSEKVRILNENYVPILQLVNENVLLFEKMRDSFKDAVLASEIKWISDTLTLKNTLNQQLVTLESYPQVINTANVQQAQANIDAYYQYTLELAHEVIANKENWQADEHKIQQVERYLNNSHHALIAMKKDVQQGFRQTLTEIKHLHQQLLYWASIIALSSMLLLISVTLFVSLSTRRSISQVVMKTKALALGSTDFSQRITRQSNDELSALVYWFNKLSDKLEQDYLQVKNISITDKLTQLNNRTRTDQFFPEAIYKAQQENHSLYVVILDIDHFKKINDNYGHLHGDKVLQEFANRLKKYSSEPDYISRWGGEEFLLIWSKITPEAALAKAEHLREKIAATPFEQVGYVTTSIGVSKLLPNEPLSELIKRADKNLYQAKHAGRNNVIFNIE